MELSVVIPIYHTAKNAMTHLPSVISVLRSKYKDFEIIFVIDNDRIEEGVKELLGFTDKYKEVKLYQLNKNYGQHFATLCGYYLAQSDFIMSVDEDMTKYLVEAGATDAYKQYDVFYFYYDKKGMYKSATRKLLSRTYNYMINKIVNLQKHTTFRVISKTLRDRMMEDKHIFWNLDVMIFNNTYNIGSKEVENCQMTDDDSSYNYKRLFQVAFEVAYEHNTIFVNMLIAIFPALFYYVFYRDPMRTWVVYVFFSIVVTLFFSLLKKFTPSTKTKTKAALKRKQ